ncbi:MAG: hypothetical protein GY870_06885 [archaeon]|nr:hypothetical protein [archaeon]
MNNLQKKQYIQGLIDEETNRLDILYEEYVTEQDQSIQRINRLENKLIKEQAYD